MGLDEVLIQIASHGLPAWKKDNALFKMDAAAKHIQHKAYLKKSVEVCV